MNQEDKIREWIKSIHINKANLTYISESNNINGTLYLDMQRVLKEAIQFGSQLTAERAKEKVIALTKWKVESGSYHAGIIAPSKDSVLQAIEESKL